MKFWQMALAATGFVALAACGQSETPQESSGDPAAAPPAAPAPAATQELSIELSALAQEGQRAWLRCQACHTLAPDAPHSTGPNLNGLIGASAGAKEDYPYSPVLAESDIVWTAETLDAWIASPQQLVPGNKMVFAGLPSPDDRAALVQYLTEVTASDAYDE